jgi:outer membrane lipoprotein-sorting protein
MLLMTLSVMVGLPCLSAFTLEDIPPREVISKSNESITLLNLSDDKTIKAQIHITLIDNRDNKREREIAYCRQDWRSESTKAIFSFLEPPDMKGIGFLTRNYDDERKKDDQWLYIPGRDMVDRVTPSEENDSFMEETDIAYSDLGDWDMKDYEFQHLSPEVIDGIECYHVELQSKDADVVNKTGYARMEVWVHPEIWMFVKIRFYDRNEKPLKDLTIGDIEQIDGFWTPRKFHMTNIQKNHQTIVTFSHIRYNIQLDNGLFSSRRLTKGEPCFRKEREIGQ